MQPQKQHSQKETMKSTILYLYILFCCASAQNNGTCNKIKDQTSCESAGCYFCTDQSKCRVGASSCPGGGGGGGGSNTGTGTGTDADADADTDSGSGNSGGGAMNGTCNPIKSQAACESAGCFFCADTSKCRVSEDRCPVEDEDEEADADTDIDADGGGGSMNGTCNPIKDQSSCESAGCFFCTGKSKCRVSEEQCPGTDEDEDTDADGGGGGGGSMNGTCNPIKDQSSCEAAGCFFCTDKSKCRVSADLCPGTDEDEDTDGDGDGDGDGGGSMNGTCNPIKDQASCEAAGCFFCTDKSKCRASVDRCPNASEEGTCNPIQDQVFCEELGCFYCSESNKCRVSEDRCPVATEDGDEDEDGDTSGATEPSVSNGTCNPIKDQTSCESAGCFFCSSDKCRTSESNCPGGGDNGSSNGNGQNQNGICNPIKDATSCTDAGCFFCENKGLCRATEEKCPAGGSGSGNGFGNDICFPFKGDEEACTGAGCVFCGGSSAHCRLDQAECPGQGRGNPCKSLEESDCSASDECLWCAESSACTAARGGACATAAGFSPGNQCKGYTTEAECTDGDTANCRWCPDNLKCKKADDTCDYGGEGIKGNPCKSALSSDGCASIEGCLWCEENLKCKKAEDGCDDEDEDDEGDEDEDLDEGTNGDSGGSDTGTGEGSKEITCTFTWRPDCDAAPPCQWCEAQGLCKYTGVACDAVSATVEVDIDYENPTFRVRNGGLGEADPNAVEVSLNYLFEVAQDNTEIPFSFVDVQNQDFTVSQTEGVYLGVKSRKARFATTIAGVGSVELIVYKILEEGTLTTDAGEMFKVREGDVKFNVNLSNWSFCDESTGICANSGSAAYVDIAMTVTGSAETPEVDENDASIYNLGGGVPFILSNQVIVDGIADAMPPGFPRVEQTDADGTFFVFRFPRFSETLVYDPIVGSAELKAEVNAPTLAPTASGLRPTTTGSSGGTKNTTTLMVSLLIAYLGISLF